MTSGLLSKLTMATAGAAVLGMGLATAPAPADAFVIDTTAGGRVEIEFNPSSGAITKFVFTQSKDPDYAAITRNVSLLSPIDGFGGIGFDPIKGSDLAKISTPILGGPNSFGFRVTDKVKSGIRTWFGVFATPGVFSPDNPTISGYVGVSYPDKTGFNSQIETVPEPTTIVGSLLGLGALAGARLKRKTAQQS